MRPLRITAAFFLLHVLIPFRLFSLCEWGNDDVLEWGGELGQMFRVQMDHLRASPPLLHIVMRSDRCT